MGDLFNFAIHTNDRLSEIDKFTYLRLLLGGAAYDAIAGLALCVFGVLALKGCAP